MSEFNSFIIFIFWVSLCFLAGLMSEKIKNFKLISICMILISLSLYFLLSNECFEGVNNTKNCLPRVFVYCKSVFYEKEPYQPTVTTCKNILNNKIIYQASWG